MSAQVNITTTLEDLEFDPVCEMTEKVTLTLWRWKLHIPLGPCMHPALYMVIWPCCSRVSFACAVHREPNGHFPCCRQPWRGFHLVWKRI
jgi:hypothetical protein